MQKVNIHDAKTHLSRLVERAAAGESFIIAKAGKPMVKLVPLDAPPVVIPAPERRLGMLAGQFTVPDDIHWGDEEIIRDFYGEE